MAVAIFLTPRGAGGGYNIQIGEDHARHGEGVHNLVVFDSHGRTFWAAPLSQGDWEQLRDRIDRMLRQR